MSRQLRILVSGCLGGAPIRWDASGVAVHSQIWKRWAAEGRLVQFCPEVAAGFGIPRPAAEIVGGTAADVFDGAARVLDAEGRDVTRLFLRGARLAADLAQRERVALAVLTDGSPSCGSGFVYSGAFDGSTRSGQGVTVELLRRTGIPVFAHTDLEAADAFLRAQEREASARGARRG